MGFRSRQADVQGAETRCLVTVVVGNGSLCKWDGLRRCFSESAGFRLIRRTDSISELLSYCEKQLSCVLILDRLAVEKANPLELARFGGPGGATHVLAMVEHEDFEASEALIRAGCMGVVLGPPSARILRRATRAVSSGELWASRALMTRMIRAFVVSESCELTLREREILRFIGQGCNNRQIAEKLFISRETVRWHLRSLYAKLGIQDRLSAALYAWGRAGRRSGPRVDVAKKCYGAVAAAETSSFAEAV